jgi:phage gp46-like protein
MLRITPVDDAADPYRIPDLILGTFGIGDLALTGADDPANPGDFRCGQGLKTQVAICLLTDARADPSELRTSDENRGWPGDTFDTMPGETPIGSKLWLLRRSALYDGIEVKAGLYARQALQTLIDQGAAVRVDIAVSVDRAANKLSLDVALYGRDGAQKYQDRFEILWEQVNALDRQAA